MRQLEEEWRMTWINKELSRLKNYSHYKKPLKRLDYYKLDSNENIVLEKKFTKAIALKSINDNDFREYPLEHFETLYNKIAKYVNLSTKNIGIGSGSDQIMDLILSTICKGKSAITINPTFSYFIDRCNMHNISTTLINLSELDNSLDFELFNRESKNKDIIYLASPNNPTGNQFKIEDIRNLVEISNDKLIIIDEAYVEFSNHSLSNLATKYNHVVIMRTFSKAFGLAGARVGYILANEELIDVFNQYIQLPYPLSSFSMQLAIEALENFEIIKRSIDSIKRERSITYDKLNSIKEIKVYNSDANFLFFQTFSHFNKIKDMLFKEKLLIKDFGNIGNYKGAMRATIGTIEMNDILVTTIEKATK
jgi:histidinol-phosphate aminotransferase